MKKNKRIYPILKMKLQAEWPIFCSHVISFPASVLIWWEIPKTFGAVRTDSAVIRNTDFWLISMLVCLPSKSWKELLLLASVDKSILADFLPCTQVSSLVMSLSRNVWKLWGSEGELLPLATAGQTLPSLCSAGAAHTAHLGFSPLLCILPPL